MQLFEDSWQKEESLYKILYKNYKKYVQNPIEYFLWHPTLIFLFYLIIKFGFNNIWFATALFLKIADISFKLWLIEKIDAKEELPLLIAKQRNLSPLFFYFNTLFYSFLIIMGFSF
jgi:hypothetical protein